MRIQTGDFVKYSNPYPDEMNTIFKVLEVNGDRVLLEAQVKMNILPTYVVMIKDITKA